MSLGCLVVSVFVLGVWWVSTNVRDVTAFPLSSSSAAERSSTVIHNPLNIRSFAIESDKPRQERALRVRRDTRAQIKQVDVGRNKLSSLLEITASSDSKDTVYYLLVSQNPKLVETGDFRKARETESGKVIQLTFSTSGRITVSEFSTPKLSSGLWYIGVQVREGSDSSNTVKIVYDYHDVKSAWPIAGMCVGTIVIGIVIAVVAHVWLNADDERSFSCKEWLTVVFRHWFGTGLKKYSYATGAIAMAFAVGSVQFVIARWYRMVETGDRNICYYNEKCYRPIAVADVPSNFMLSNLPYIFHGIILAVSISFRESRCWSTWREPDKKKKIPYDFSAGYSFAWALIFEGLFSTIYHLCPARMTFQFDSAFMFIISGLVIVALYNSYVVSHVFPHHLIEQTNFNNETEIGNIHNNSTTSNGNGRKRRDNAGGNGEGKINDNDNGNENENGNSSGNGNGNRNGNTNYGNCSNRSGSHENGSGNGEVSDDNADDNQNGNSNVPDGLLFNSKSSRTPVQAPAYFLFFAAPLLTFNYIGSLRDTLEEGLPTFLDVLYWFCLVVWFLLLYFRWVLPKLYWGEEKEPSKAKRCAKSLCPVVYPFFLLLIGWITWGDSSQMFLISCLGAAFFTVSGLLLFHAVSKFDRKNFCNWLRFQNCSLDFLSCHCFFFSLFIFVTFASWVGALVFFIGFPTTNKVAEPHESRSLNKECMMSGFFDEHDLWHMLSSFALMMSAYLLLYATRKIERGFWQKAKSSGKGKTETVGETSRDGDKDKVGESHVQQAAVSGVQLQNLRNLGQADTFKKQDSPSQDPDDEETQCEESVEVKT